MPPVRHRHRARLAAAPLVPQRPRGLPGPQHRCVEAPPTATIQSSSSESLISPCHLWRYPGGYDRHADCLTDCSLASAPPLLPPTAPNSVLRVGQTRCLWRYPGRHRCHRAHAARVPQAWALVARRHGLHRLPAAQQPPRGQAPASRSTAAFDRGGPDRGGAPLLHAASRPPWDQADERRTEVVGPCCICRMVLQQQTEKGARWLCKGRWSSFCRCGRQGAVPGATLGECGQG